MKRYINGIRKPFILKGGSRFVLVLLAAILFILFFRAFFFTQVRICDDREDLGLIKGDFVTVNRLSYGLRLPMTRWLGYNRWGQCNPDIGDMVVYDYPDGSGRFSIDRVIGLPGDTLWIENDPTAFTVVPLDAFGVGSVILPERCIVGRPTRVTYSVDESQPFYNLLRPERLFISIE